MRLDWVRSPRESSIPLDGVSRAEDINELVPSRFRADVEFPQHVPRNLDDVEAAEVTGQSAAAAASNMRNSAMENKGNSDIGTFPIACTLEKHA